MKLKFLIVLFSSLILKGCFWDERTEVKHLTKNFNLAWWSEPKYQSLFINAKNDEYGGVVVIEETIYEIGFNENFIIAKRHPNLQKEISTSLFRQIGENGDYKIKNPNDTVFLPNEDIVYFEKGNWYHKYNGWNPPDSLFPYKKKTYYYIIDIKNYNYNNWIERKILGKSPKYDNYKIYEFFNEGDFIKKKIELNVPEELEFKKVYEG